MRMTIATMMVTMAMAMAMMMTMISEDKTDGRMLTSNQRCTSSMRGFPLLTSRCLQFDTEESIDDEPLDERRLKLFKLLGAIESTYKYTS